MEPQLTYKLRTEYKLALGNATPCQAKLTIILPTDVCGNLHPLLRKHNLCLCEERLTAYWGKSEEESRIGITTINEISWSALATKLEEFKRELNSTLQRAYDFSRDLESLMPKNSTAEYGLDWQLWTTHPAMTAPHHED